MLRGSGTNVGGRSTFFGEEGVYSLLSERQPQLFGVGSSGFRFSRSPCRSGLGLGFSISLPSIK